LVFFCVTTRSLGASVRVPSDSPTLDPLDDPLRAPLDELRVELRVDDRRALELRLLDARLLDAVRVAARLVVRSALSLRAGAGTGTTLPADESIVPPRSSAETLSSRW
jgi:hypothetical protein